MSGKIKKRLCKKDLFSIPNLLSYIRILLVPLIMFFYIEKANYLVAGIIIALSGITDVLDGIIARKFNMVTDFGKFVDPFADKLTQFALIVCLILRYPIIITLLVLMLLKEVLLYYCGFKFLGKEDKICSAKWYGKVCTVFVYFSLLFLLFSPLFSLPDFVAYILLGLCCLFVLISTALYGRFYHKELNNE